MDKQDELELDDKAAKRGNKGMLIVILLISVLLISAAVIGGLYFTGMLESGEAAKPESAENKSKAKAEQQPVKPAQYLDLAPPFVVNFEDQSNATYLQIEMQVMARDKTVLDEVKNHMPVIRNNILLVMSGQKFEEVRTRTGKERLQQSILEAIQQVVAEATRAKPQGDKAAAAASNVEQVYFTSFIMQ